MPTLAVITTPHWDDLVALGALVVVVFALCHLARRLIDLAIAAMQQAWRLMRRRPELLGEYADFNRDPADNITAIADANRESHSWPNMAPLLVEDAPVDDDPARYATGGPISSRPGLLLVNESGCDFVLPMRGDLPPEKPAETSQPRHSADDTVTELFPVVVDGPHAIDIVAAVVSGQDGAT